MMLNSPERIAHAAMKNIILPTAKAGLKMTTAPVIIKIRPSNTLSHLFSVSPRNARVIITKPERTRKKAKNVSREKITIKGANKAERPKRIAIEPLKATSHQFF